MKKIHSLNTISGGLSCNLIFEITPTESSDDINSIVNIACLSCSSMEPAVIEEAITDSAEACVTNNQPFLLAIDVQNNSCAIYKYYY